MRPSKIVKSVYPEASLEAVRTIHRRDGATIVTGWRIVDDSDYRVTRLLSPVAETSSRAWNLAARQIMGEDQI